MHANMKCLIASQIRLTQRGAPQRNIKQHDAHGQNVANAYGRESAPQIMPQVVQEACRNEERTVTNNFEEVIEIDFKNMCKKEKLYGFR